MDQPVDGMRAVVSKSGLHVTGPTQDAPTRVVEVLAYDGLMTGAVYGPVIAAEARALVESLAAGRDPGGPDAPWLAVAALPGGGLAAAASTMLPSGLFWSASSGVLIVASDPASARGASTGIDPDYIREFAAGVVPPGRTPFLDVHRVPAGATARWATPDSAPALAHWSGPRAWPEPHLRGPGAMAAYLDAFDGVLRGLAARCGSVVTTVSGGLDSTFVAAGLARLASDESPVLGLTYAPLAAAHVAAAPGVDADESALAAMLAQQYPGRLAIEVVTNAGLVRPLHAAALTARRGGVPLFNPANEPWLSSMRESAADAGARMLFVGTNGNAAFSFEHGYAARYSLARGRFGDLVRMARDPDGRLTSASVRRRVLGPLRRQATAGTSDRAAFLAWLARERTGIAAAANPAATRGVLMADPFSARAVLEVAAAIDPAEWQVGGRGRGFARRAGQGRVPDAIRLRSSRGQQGRDAWYVIRNDRDEYLDRIAGLPSVPGLAGVDAGRLSAHVAAWPWGEAHGPAWPEHVAVDRLLGVAEFAGIW
ncbi:MAG: asparagine synthase-related protein [Actinomycetota bacterium]|nr:asparagine synthase-related protein [Actinomycetota bacterium]